MCSWSAGGRCRRHSSIRSRRGCGPAEGVRGGRPPASLSRDAPSRPAGPPRARRNGLTADLGACSLWPPVGSRVQRHCDGVKSRPKTLAVNEARNPGILWILLRRSGFGGSPGMDSFGNRGILSAIFADSLLFGALRSSMGHGRLLRKVPSGGSRRRVRRRRGRQPRQPPATHPTPAAGMDITPSLKTPAGFSQADNAPTATRNHPRHPQPLCGQWRCSQPGHQAPHHRTPQRTGTVNRGAQSATSRRAAPPRGGSRRRRIQPRVWRAPHPALPSPPPPRQG
jgi:hypothetical protein